MAVPGRGPIRRLSLRRPALVASLAAGVLAAGCDRQPAGLDPDVYVEAMARLSFADIQLFEEARLDSARRVILDELGVTAADLVAFAERNGEDVGLMQELWGRIRERVDSLEARATGIPTSPVRGDSARGGEGPG